MKTIRMVTGLGAVVCALLFAANRFGRWEVKQLEKEVARLEQERTQLVEYAERLSASRRVAQVNVVSQMNDELGRTVTSLRWQEIGPQGILGEPIDVQVLGRQVYFEALVIKFEHQHVGEGDPGQSTSVALFRRIFGELQAPESVSDLDRHIPPPSAVLDASEHLSAELWYRFWDLVDDPRQAAKYGVRVAQCEAPAVRMSEDQVWEIVLDAAGGLNLRRLADQSMTINTIERP